MSDTKKRFFVVLDKNVVMDKHDMAHWLAFALEVKADEDLSVYDSLDDLLKDKAEKLDMFKE